MAQQRRSRRHRGAVSRGGIEVLDLRDEALPAVVRTRLDERYEPLLLIGDDDQLKVLSGVRLRLCLLRLLGVKASAQLLTGLTPTQAVSQAREAGLTRRQFMKLAGMSTTAATAAVMLGLPSAAAWANGIPGTPPQGSRSAAGSGPGKGQLGGPLDAITLNAVRSSSEVIAATRHFGKVDWSQARALLNKDSQQVGVFAPLVRSSNGGEVPYLALVFLSARPADSIVVRSQRSGSGSLIEIRATSGKMLFSATLTTDGKLNPAVGSDTVSPDAGFFCALYCGGVAAAECRYECVLGPEFCAACFALEYALCIAYDC